MYEIKEKESTVSSVDILVLNPFLANVSILYPLKIRQNQRFSVFFSGSIEWEHWPEKIQEQLFLILTFQT